MKCFVIDITKCIGCYNCQVSCKDEHFDNDWTPYAKPQPEGHFWMKVTEIERGTIPKVRVNWIPTPCLHCEDAPCAIACGEGAIYTRDDGIVIIDPVKCRGTGKCIEACPYNAIYFNEELNISQKCTMCAHLLDEGWEQPRCIRACPTGALEYGEYEDMQQLIKKAEILPADNNNPAPKVKIFYIGLPTRFIAGEVYSPAEDLCIDGASITAKDLTTGEFIMTKTNNYGDFWLEKINNSTYSIAIEKDGYYSKEIHITADNDINLGPIKLYKKV